MTMGSSNVAGLDVLCPELADVDLLGLPRTAQLYICPDIPVPLFHVLT